MMTNFEMIIFQYVLKKCGHQHTFEIVGYCYGSMIAIELVRRLEAQGLNGKLILIDGALQHSRTMLLNRIKVPNNEYLENVCFSAIINTLTPMDNDKVRESKLTISSLVEIAFH